MSPLPTYQGQLENGKIPAAVASQYAPTSTPSSSAPVVTPAPVNTPAKPYISQEDFGKDFRSINPKLTDGQVSDAYNAFYPPAGNSTTPETASPDSASPNRPIYTDQNEPAVVNPQSEDDLITQKTKQAQDQIASLNKYYDTLRDEQMVTNAKNSRSTDSISTLTGLAGSTEAGTAAAATSKANDRALGAVEAERTAKIQSVLSDIRTSAVEEAKQSRLEARQSEQDRIAYREKSQADAVSHLSTLAKAGSGVTLEGLKATLKPEEYNYLVKNAGGEEMVKAILFENRSKNSILGTPQLIGGKMVQAYTKPDGTVTYETIPLPEGVDPGNIKSIEKTDNGIFIINNDGTYSRVTGSEKAGTSTSDTGPYIAGANPTVDAWASRIQSGQAKLSDITGTANTGLKNQVVKALEASNGKYQGNGLTALQSDALSTAQDLMDKFTSGNTFAVGGTSIFPLRPGGPANDFKAKYDQLISQLQLDNVKYLKGQGAVSDSERKILSDASTALRLSQSEGEFKKTLEGIITTFSAVGTKNKQELETVGADTSQAPVKTGTLPDGTPVKMYSDGTIKDDAGNSYDSDGNKLSFNAEGSDSKNAGKNRAQKNNNPLNIKSSAFTASLPGVKGSDGKPALDGGNFLVFNSPEAGFNAAKTLITSSGYKNLSVDQAMKRWSNNGYGGEIAPALKDKTINELSPTELESLLNSMAHREGFYA